MVYEAKGNYDQALEYYHKALKIDYRVFDVDENQKAFCVLLLQEIEECLQQFG
jgi:tetratricopeptide (TPR) repeat protein